MRNEEAIEVIKSAKYYGSTGIYEAIEMAVDALKLKDELLSELDTFMTIIQIQYSIWFAYGSLKKEHSCCEDIAYDGFGVIAQEIQWLVDRLGGYDTDWSDDDDW